MERFIIRDRAIRDRAAQAVAHIEHEPLMEVQIKPYKKSKTLEQLGYLFGVVLKKIAERIEESGGDHYGTDDLYEWFIDKYGERKIISLHGEAATSIVSASKMNTKQMSDFTNRIIDYAATCKDLDYLAIPPPEYRE